MLGREDQVALVLAVLVVDDDDRLAGGDVGDGPLDVAEPGHRSSPVGDRSQQPLDVLGEHVDLEVHRISDRPGAQRGARQRLRDQADGEPSPAIAVTVRLTPSTVIEPFVDDVAGELRAGRRRPRPVLGGRGAATCRRRRRGPARCDRRAGRRRTARSRFTGIAGGSAPSEERRSVSAITSAVKPLPRGRGPGGQTDAVHRDRVAGSQASSSAAPGESSAAPRRRTGRSRPPTRALRRCP